MVLASQSSKNVLLRMVTVRLYGNIRTLQTIAPLEEASTVTLVDEMIVDILNIKGQSQQLCIQGTNELKHCHDNSITFDIQISGVGEGVRTYILICSKVSTVIVTYLLRTIQI